VRSAGQIGRVKGNCNQSRKHYRIGLGLLLTGGSVAFVSAVTVIMVLFALVSAREAAIEPLRQGTRLFVDALAARIHDHLRTAESQGDFISGVVARDLADGADAAQLTRTLAASLAAAPQVASIVYLRPDLTGLEVRREPSGPARVQILDLSGDAEAHRYAREVRAQEEGSWGQPFTLARSPGLAVLNYRVPLRDPHDGAEPGMIVVTLRSDRLSRFMRELSAPPVRAAFILYGSDRVLAYPDFDGSMGSMPKLAEMRDPALRALVRPAPGESFFGERLDGALTLRHVDGRQLLYLLRDLPGFAPEPLWVGAYVDLNDVGVGSDRFYMIAMVGLSIVVAAAVMAALLARRLTSSIRNLADIAAAIGRVELDELRPPRASRVRELDELARAFALSLRTFSAFATYVPRQLVRQLLAIDPAARQPSEQRELTVMFTDLSGFSRLAERLSAEATARLLNDHFRRLTACIVAEGGTVDKFLGDAVMAFWGAPERQADHAARAIRAALAMQEAYQDDPLLRDHGLGLRIGLHTGTVLVGDIGTAERLNYTIVGDAVNVAARLVDLGHHAGGGSDVVVLLSETTVRAAGAQAIVEDLGDQAMRGRFRAERVYRLPRLSLPQRRSPAAIELPIREMKQS